MRLIIKSSSSSKNLSKTGIETLQTRTNKQRPPAKCPLLFLSTQRA